MSKKEWLDSNRTPELLLQNLRLDGITTGKKGKRKRRLFACTCCRRAWHLLPEGIFRDTIQLVECVAEGCNQPIELKAVHEHLRQLRIGEILPRRPRAPGAVAAFEAVRSLVRGEEGKAATLISYALAEEKFWSDHSGALNLQSAKVFNALKEAESSKQALLLRDIFGNPYRTISVATRCLSWNDRIVPRLAQAIYDEHAFDRLPILADALEEAGCTDADILNHCRQPGEHVRGCWVVDLLLGKS